MQVFFLILFIAVISYVGWTVYTEYSQSKATGFQRLIEAAEGSATILWSKFVMLIGSLAGLLASAADYFNAPEVSNVIKAAMKPEYVAAFTVLVTVVTIWARKRTL